MNVRATTGSNNKYVARLLRFQMFVVVVIALIADAKKSIMVFPVSEPYFCSNSPIGGGCS